MRWRVIGSGIGFRADTASAPQHMDHISAARTDGTRDEIAALFDLPFAELVFRAAEVHRAHHDAGAVQLSTLLSVKTGGCPEDCGYCSQSVKAESGVKATKLMDVRQVLQSAARGQGRRLDPLLHGRRLAQSQGPRHARDHRNGPTACARWAWKPA